ncbi:protein MAIN-LIKE 1-like [Vigna umbellata]|uniref:protein MAIN-LIKE 1-like n=1 Tax=Vigna umbellata TaxID=87088 RepID=UPI001F5EC4A9|nr:protein MAIN-LIKE 1-like [Vigna umbellata]
MVRTRGASFSSRGESSTQGESWRRSTSSAYRRRAGPIEDDPYVEERAFEEQTYEAYETHGQEDAFQAPDDDDEEHANVHNIQEDIGGFPGGPRDDSLLTHYVQHVAYAISQGRLMSLTDIYYDYVDKGLLLGFIERWHFETSSFHLPLGEMSVTLDDVSTLPHLPVMGQMCDLEELEFEEARTTLVQLLNVDGGTAGAEMEDARGLKVRLSWLREIYVQRCESQHWDYAVRAYLLHLVGCTIFANKSASSIRVSYLLLFGDVHACGRYAWGVAALAHLYKQLGDASLASTKQMVGYLTLFQLDALTYSGVVWHPYEGHRAIRPFFGICMYSGWIRIGDTLCRHLPERVLRQFGFQQDIPRSPTAVPDVDIVAIDDVWLHFRAHVVNNVRHATFPSDCVDWYIQWFRRVLHPYIIVVTDDARPALAPRQRPDVPQEARPHRRTSPPSPSGALVSMDLLHIANEGIDEYSPTRRG